MRKNKKEKIEIMIKLMVYGNEKRKKKNKHIDEKYIKSEKNKTSFHSQHTKEIRKKNLEIKVKRNKGDKSNKKEKYKFRKLQKYKSLNKRKRQKKKKKHLHSDKKRKINE